jgi:hypothetical protein
VIEVIYGIVFLGTPHLPLNAAPSPNIIDLILRLQQRTSPRKHALTVNDNVLDAINAWNAYDHANELLEPYLVYFELFDIARDVYNILQRIRRLVCAPSVYLER